MTDHILVPVDGSTPSWNALEHAFDHHEGAQITVLHVVDPVEGVYNGGDGSFYDSDAYDRAVDRGKALYEQARDRLEERGAKTTTVLESAVETGRPARTILQYADDHGVDQIVIGSHGRTGMSRILLGSVAETVTRRAAVPVTVVRG